MAERPYTSQTVTISSNTIACEHIGIDAPYASLIPCTVYKHYTDQSVPVVEECCSECLTAEAILIGAVAWPPAAYPSHLLKPVDVDRTADSHTAFLPCMAPQQHYLIATCTALLS